MKKEIQLHNGIWQLKMFGNATLRKMNNKLFITFDTNCFNISDEKPKYTYHIDENSCYLGGLIYNSIHYDLYFRLDEDDDIYNYLIARYGNGDNDYLYATGGSVTIYPLKEAYDRSVQYGLIERDYIGDDLKLEDVIAKYPEELFLRKTSIDGQ
jgi:hypothetical protein